MAMVLQPMFAGLAPGARRAFFACALIAICFLFAFPVLWLILTSLRPESGVYYVHRGTEFTLASFVEVLQEERLGQAFVNSALISTPATGFPPLVTVSRRSLAARFNGPG